MLANEAITLTRECSVIEVPGGVRRIVPAGTDVRIIQSLGGSYTVWCQGAMVRIDAQDADVLGLKPPPEAELPANGDFNEKMVWDQLKQVYDPEIPVNVADLGLIYSCVNETLAGGGRRIDVKMAMTAPGCGMADVLKADVEGKLGRLPTVKEVHVEVVFEPPWDPSRMSQAARLQLGFDL
jgi:probable FeS assembly SUF system protein SufT